MMLGQNSRLFLYCSGVRSDSDRKTKMLKDPWPTCALIPMVEIFLLMHMPRPHESTLDFGQPNRQFQDFQMKSIDQCVTTTCTRNIVLELH